MIIISKEFIPKELLRDERRFAFAFEPQQFYELSEDFLQSAHHQYVLEQFETSNSIGFATNKGKAIPVYNPTLCAILTSHKVLVTLLGTNQSLFINGVYYQDVYTKGFEQGINNFFEHPSRNIYENTSSYLADLRSHYYGISNQQKVGWIFFKKYPPRKINFSSIFDWGYIGGMLYKLEGLAIQYPTVFEDFFKHSPIEQRNDSSPKSQSEGMQVQERPVKIDNMPPKEPDFENYLTDKGKPLLPFLQKEYSNAKPERIAYMLFALKDLELIINSFSSNKTELHAYLSKAFGDIGTRQGLTININNLDSASQYQEQKIKAEKRMIKANMLKK